MWFYQQNQFCFFCLRGNGTKSLGIYEVVRDFIQKKIWTKQKQFETVKDFSRSTSIRSLHVSFGGGFAVRMMKRVDWSMFEGFLGRLEWFRVRVSTGEDEEDERRRENNEWRERNERKKWAEPVQSLLYRRAGPSRFKPDPASWILGH